MTGPEEPRYEVYQPPPEQGPDVDELPSAAVAEPRRRSAACLGLLTALLAVLAAVVVGVVAVVGDLVGDGDVFTDGPLGSDGFVPTYDSATYAPGTEVDEPGEINVLSEGGFTDLVRALREATGDDEVFSVVIYPTYAALDVPVEATGGREQSLFWNGELDEPTSFGTSDEERFSLGDLDPAVIVELAARARDRLVEDPTLWYVIVRAPDAGSDVWLYGYASNKYNEGGYLAARRDGTVVDRVTY